MQNPSWPAFLNLLSSDPDAAFADFYRFAVGTLVAVPPRLMRSLSNEDREDLTQEIIYHCVKDDFRVLRQYVDKGRPFAVWLYAVAHNFCLDYLRSKGRNPDTTSIHENANGPGLENVLTDRHNDGQNRPELLELLTIVKKTLELVGEYCRVLLEMAADEFTPREMTLVLGMTPDQNKKVSDDLRYCRKKLKDRLAEKGIDIDSFLKD